MGQENYWVDPVLCVGCDACCNAYPNNFKMGADGIAFTVAMPVPEGKFDPQEVVNVCPVAAIKLKEKPDLKPTKKAGHGHEVVLTVVEGWQAEWEKHRFELEPETDRETRYGRNFKVTESDDLFNIRIERCRTVPHCMLKYMFGLEGTDVDYKYKAVLQADHRTITLEAWLEDPKLLKLARVLPSFPERFRIEFPLPEEVDVVDLRAWQDHVEISTHKSGAPAEPGRAPRLWDKHYITDSCTGCTVCAIKCPTGAITGEKKGLHLIDPSLCINCSVCGIYCAFDSITGPEGTLIPRIKPADVPKAKVIPDLCTGCDFCVAACPFDCITLEDYDGTVNKVAVVVEDKCVSCKLCEEVCIKGAIIVERQVSNQEQIGASFRPLNLTIETPAY